ncbi:hypothetical protein OZX72_08955 [Bifidobacterium sp. ESL0769]|uniref:hypothetical protein n=1 Tax=Bifidobacterium sp. ESL0769 TaxID=2983229 RepID=UPI0023F87F82|nr:hypothetical protein [Bifidobacterium sp. ESL0769]WEV67344.1 hypothetical protein OZX72_08955 [Bifidobacterium sp. ESL0769]
MEQQYMNGQMAQPFAKLASDEQHYDFILTVPVMEEFVDAANAYGRKLQFFSITFFAICSAGEIISILDGVIYQQKHPIFFGAVTFILLSAFLIIFFSRGIRHMAMMFGLYRQWHTWFPAVTSNAMLHRLQWRRVTGAQLYGPGWETPCRLTASNRGLELIRWVSGKTYTVSVPWDEVECVRRTPHAIVIGPSAAGKINTTIFNGRGYRLGNVDDCVLVDTRALADPDGFADWCRSRMLNAHQRTLNFAPNSSKGRRLRFRRWFYGDDL